MGMYDDIEISKSYTRNLLTKKQEKILNLCKSNDYQTKSLDNALLKFSFYRSKLYKSEWDDKNKKFTKRKPVKFTGVVNAYKVIKKDDKDYWVELDFTVKDGVLDAKELVKFEILDKKDDTEFNIKNALIEEFEKKLKIRFYNWLRRKLLALGNILIDKTTYKSKK